FPAPTVEAALELAQGFENPLLAGGFGGRMPAAFEMEKSPAELACRCDTHRPLVLVSSSGTRGVHEAKNCGATSLCCFRRAAPLAGYLAERHSRIAVIGAGSLGEFREEDQMCCAWIASGLMSRGYVPE